MVQSTLSAYRLGQTFWPISIRDLNEDSGMGGLMFHGLTLPVYLTSPGIVLSRPITWTPVCFLNVSDSLHFQALSPCRLLYPIRAGSCWLPLSQQPLELNSTLLQIACYSSALFDFLHSS